LYVRSLYHQMGLLMLANAEMGNVSIIAKGMQ
jgi:hypothetical protein